MVVSFWLVTSGVPFLGWYLWLPISDILLLIDYFWLSISGCLFLAVISGWLFMVGCF